MISDQKQKIEEVNSNILSQETLLKRQNEEQRAQINQIMQKEHK